MKKTVSKASLKKETVVNLITKIVIASEDECTIDPKGSQVAPYIGELCGRLGLTPIEALLLAVFVNRCDDSRINYKDIASHFSVRPLELFPFIKDIDSLVNKKVIVRRRDSDGDVTYRVPNSTIEYLLEGKMPDPDKYDGLSARDFIDTIDRLLKARDNREINDNELHCTLHNIIDSNQQLIVAQKLKSFKLNDDDLVLYLVMCMCFINDHDDRIARCDIDDYFDTSTFRHHANLLESGRHPLMTFKLVEHSCIDGQIENTNWMLTNYSKEEVLAELNLKVKHDMRANLTRHEEICEKSLFYNERVSKQVKELESLLDEGRMKRVMEKLKAKGMRQGFTCLFYGGPGTGKTETVMQLARRTSRDIMLVDVPSIRSKWVGETEKNIKEIFDRYKKVVKNNDIAPILLFNEADALLNKRSEGATNSVDKMENAMQNIILQEMENLEGIMIATTNLTGSLDAAFERRFLYKLEFEKPAPKERMNIWRAMLPELTEQEALSLAEQFDFSGGQIENIARKQAINSILSDADEVSMDAVIENCKTELLEKKSRQRIGF